MKKQYKAPKCETIVIDMQDIIATSPNLSGNYSDPEEEGLAKGRFLEYIYSDDDDEEFL